VLSNNWLGGELWHNMFAARGRMLEYSLELERKISESTLTEGEAHFMLVFCGEGFHWHEDELEDFVAYYNSGAHRADDAFGAAEDRYVQERHIAMTKAISRFACMRRLQGDVSIKRINWNVQPPTSSSFMYGSA